MSSIFDKLEKRRGARYAKRKSGKSIQKCPKTTGDVLVMVYREGSNLPIAGMVVDIPRLGTATTDSNGIAEWLEKDPGACTYMVQHAGTAYAGKRWRNDTNTFMLWANNVSIHQASVASAGALRVRVRNQRTQALLPAADVLSIEGTGLESKNEADRTFNNLAVDKYTITARIDKGDAYAVGMVSSAPVDVLEGQTTDVILDVPELTWVEVKVRDLTDIRNVPNARVKLKMGAAAEKTVTVGANAVAREESAQANDTCTLKEVEVPDDRIYELVEIV